MRGLSGRKAALRPLTPADAPELFEALSASREALKRRFSWASAASGLPGCEAFIARAAQDQDAGRSEVFAVVELKPGRLAGIASLQDLDQVPGVARAALWIRTDRAERGLAGEAARLLVGYAFKGERLRRVSARIDPSNRPARKVLQKLGFKYEGCLRQERRLNGRWVDQECWGLLREEWKR